VASVIIIHAANAQTAPEAASSIATTAFRPLDEVGNNLAHPTWGTANTQLLRGPSGAHYDDSISAPARPSAPSARAVSNAIFAQTGPVFSKTGLSDFIWTWGQFLDHDLSLTPGNQESLPIPMPTGDAFFDPTSTGTQIMPFHRASFDTDTGTSPLNPRQQINQDVGFIDGSNVYGSDAARAAWLRTGTSGMLKVTKTSVGDLLPFNDGTQGNAGSPEAADTSNTLFVAGDVRSNEQPTLACMHTLFVREHNRLAARFADEHPYWSDELLYQHARRIVIAEIQHITYDEFLPALLGVGSPLERYHGYEPTVNASVATAFSTAAYRLGHTLLSPSIQRLNADGTSIPAGPLALRDSFFQATPPLVMAFGIEPYFRGLAAQTSQELDHFIIDDVRNFLFGKPGMGGLDLPSLNVQRGRDLGLPAFNALRADYGLPPKTSFAEVTSDPDMQAALASLYPSVDAIDPFAGLFVEDHIPHSNVGETLRAVLFDQFRRSRAGDRFWYERTLTPEELEQVKATTLSQIIKRNTRGTQSLQNRVFFAVAPGDGDSHGTAPSPQ
jgi:hypothetical protein